MYTSLKGIIILLFVNVDPDRPPALAPVKTMSRVNSNASLASVSTALSSCEAGSPMMLLFEELRSGIQIDLKADQEFYGDSESVSFVIFFHIV